MSNDLEAVCRALASLSGAWSWDGRFGAVVAAFDAAQEPATRAAVGEQLDRGWNTTDLASVPQRVRALVGKLGGLRPEQSLYTREIEGALVWCAWWPWQSGTRFSLRIAVDAATAVDPRPWFGL
jgi:hypothetical protein